MNLQFSKIRIVVLIATLIVGILGSIAMALNFQDIALAAVVGVIGLANNIIEKDDI